MCCSEPPWLPQLQEASIKEDVGLCVPSGCEFFLESAHLLDPVLLSCWCMCKEDGDDMEWENVKTPKKREKAGAGWDNPAP